MPTSRDTNSTYDALPVGGQLGHLEYVVTDELLEQFRNAVEFPEACFPSIAVEEYIEVLVRKYGFLPLASAKHSERYYAHPRPNKRIQVSGWVRDKYQRQGHRWLVVDTFAVDEDGREILRSEHTFLLAGQNGESFAV